jgi:methionyl-tRNA synthetase
MFLMLNHRFLADRFVEGTCPHCSYEVYLVVIYQITTNFSYKDARGDQCDLCSRTLDAIELIKPRCLIDKSHKIVTRSSAHMYIRLDELQPRVGEWVKQSWAKGKWSPNAVINGDGELVDALLKTGLKPSPVTRDLKWGIPVPVPEDDPDQDMKGKVLCECYTTYNPPI